jgi:hypothetical protein
MMSRRTAAVVILVVMGTLQLWDSDVFDAGAAVIAIAVFALLLPIGALLFTERMDLRIGSVVACAALLMSAKVVTPLPLPALGVAAVIAAAANWLAASKKVSG